MEKKIMFYVRFVGDRATFGVSVIASDEDHARRVAELYFFDEYGFDLSLCRWEEIEIEEDGELV